MESGDFEEGERLLATASDWLPRDVDIAINRAIFLKRLRRYDDAKKAAKAAISLAPNDPECCYLLGGVYRQMHQYRSAVRWYRRALALKDTYVDALNNLGLTLYDMGRFTEALEVVQQGRSLEPGDQELTINLACISWSLGRRRDALTVIKELVAGNDSDPTALYWLGTLRSWANQPRQAVRAFNRSLSIEPGNTHAMWRLGVELTKLGKANEAEELLLGAHKLAPNDFNVLLSLASTYLSQEQFSRARSFVKATLRLEPRNPFGAELMGEVCRVEGEFADALSYFEKAIQLDGENPWRLSRMGAALRGLGRFDEAKSALDKALGILPSDAFALDQIAELSFAVGESEFAAQL